jgi:hypothetical protein
MVGGRRALQGMLKNPIIIVVVVGNKTSYELCDNKTI